MTINNVTSVSDAFLCSSCGACKAICPKDSISFKSSSIGRLKVVVNETCIDCGACLKVCQSIDYHNLRHTFADRYIGEIKSVYIGKANNKNIFRESQSGGACTATLIYLFGKGLIDAAIVCRMISANPPSVKAYVAESVEQLYESQKSKYTPVELLSALKQTASKKSVAIVGLPCHLEGAESLKRQSKKFHNITYKLGLICDRTLCSTLEDVVMSYADKKEPGIIEWRKKDFTFGGKYYPYRTAPIRIIYSDNESMVLPNTYRFALKNMFTPPRCRVCYDKLNTFADIVFGDPWGMSDVDWNKGESLVFTRTPLGETLINEMKETGAVTLKSADKEELLKGQHIKERRKSVSLYSAALNSLSIPKVDSYLYHQNDVEIKSNEEIFAARKTLETFVSDEQLGKEELIRKARRIIRNATVKSRLNNLILIRVIKKIYRIIKH